MIDTDMGDMMNRHASEVTQEQIDKAHLVALEIMDSIEKVCTKHNITWWVESGTLLGAVRHNGFIPWDDDCDIAMMRDDYEKFLQVAPKEIGEGFYVQIPGVDKYYPKKLVKVRKLGTKLVDEDESFDEKYNQGIFVDVFCWDCYYGWEKKLIDIFEIVPAWRNKRHLYPKGSIKRTLHSVATAIPYAVHRILEKAYVSARLLWRRNKSLPYIRYEAEGDWGYFCKQDDVLPVKHDIEFEGRYYPVPNNSHNVLTGLFGNYMELPPEDARHGHAQYIEC